MKKKHCVTLITSNISSLLVHHAFYRVKVCFRAVKVAADIWDYVERWRTLLDRYFVSMEGTKQKRKNTNFAYEPNLFNSSALVKYLDNGFLFPDI